MNATPSGGSPDGDGPALPAPRSGTDPLPRRTRSGGERAEPAPNVDLGRDPEGRRYTRADAATLDRLLTGLREI